VSTGINKNGVNNFDKSYRGIQLHTADDHHFDTVCRHNRSQWNTSGCFRDGELYVLRMLPKPDNILVLIRKIELFYNHGATSVWEVAGVFKVAFLF
jgi:hypothetical protein